MEDEFNIQFLPFSKVQLIDALEKKLVTVRKHPDQSLYIFNYTPLAQYSKQWNEVTKNCRGLVLDDDYNIVARPFPKIFNYNEVPADPVILSRPPVVQDKLDGSLGIAYKSKRGWRISTRGSFTSDQAEWANKWLVDNHPNYDQPESMTCLFEIIYPDNRICVNYGDRAELVLIAAINNVTGSDMPLEAVTWWNGTTADRLSTFTHMHDVYAHATSDDYDGKEGVVCTWLKYNEPSFRLKIKHPEYVRLHGIIHAFSKKKVWESLSNNEDFIQLLGDVPDEFYAIVEDTVNDLYLQYNNIEKFALEDFGKISHLSSRKDFAEEAKKSVYAGILFKMLDNKDYSQQIWNMIKPEGEV